MPPRPACWVSNETPRIWSKTRLPAETKIRAEELNMVSNKSVEYVWVRIHCTSAVTARRPSIDNERHSKQANTFFFIAYVACQVPANMIIPHVRPSIMLPACVVVWGTIAGLMSLVQDHKGLWAARFALGIAEAVSVAFRGSAGV